MDLKLNIDRLVDATPLHRTISWSSEKLGVSADEFAETVERLYELDRDGAIDLLSVTRECVSGTRQVRAVTFIHLAS